MTDLEKQLQASLPGRPTEVQDYAALHVARRELELAAVLLQSAAARIRTATTRDRRGATWAEEARLLAAKAVNDTDYVIRMNPAGKVPR
jgi:hypothetical protein